MTGRLYGLRIESGFDEQLKAAPEDVQDAFRQVLSVLLVNPLPGYSLLDIRPIDEWAPDTFSVALPGGRALLRYRVPVDRRIVEIISLIWA